MKKAINQFSIFMVGLMILLALMVGFLPSQTGVNTDASLHSDGYMNHWLLYGEEEKVSILASEEKVVHTIPDNQEFFAYLYQGDTPLSISLHTDKGHLQYSPLLTRWGEINLQLPVGYVAGKDVNMAVNFPRTRNLADYTLYIDHTMKVERKKVEVFHYKKYSTTYYVTTARVIAIKVGFEPKNEPASNLLFKTRR